MVLTCCKNEGFSSELCELCKCLKNQRIGRTLLKINCFRKGIYLHVVTQSHLTEDATPIQLRQV